MLLNQGNSLPLGADVKLAPLSNNGGPTQTHAFLSGSPLLNTGSNPAALTNDQRGIGYGRNKFGAPDIGAYELQGASIAPPSLVWFQVNDGSDQRSNVFSFRITFSEEVTFPSGIDAAFRLLKTGPGTQTGAVGLSCTQDGAVIVIGGMPGGTIGLEPNGSLMDGRYRLTIMSSMVMGANGPLDGNGDGASIGAAEDNAMYDAFRLFGDSDGDGMVTGTDFLAFRLAFLGNSPTFDFDGDGQATGSDYLQFRLRFLQSI